MTKYITVGYDGTTPSTEAVRWAASEAASRSAELRIVSCYDLPVSGDAMVGAFPAEACVSLLADVETRLEAIKQSVIAEHHDLDVSTVASPGPASSVLVREAGPDDVVVVGASGHSGAAAFWLGSTPRSLARHASCPVVVVRGAATRGKPDRVLVGIDGSPSADEALEWAGDEADRHGVPLVVVHGWHYPYLVSGTSTAQGRDLTEIDAACVLERGVEMARERCATDVTGRLIEASPATALLDAARDGDLLVVGSSGRGALSATFFGSTVNSVLEQAAVPVVVVRGGHAKR
jgi:nucleotide-binding universal stress UspA family protein